MDKLRKQKKRGGNRNRYEIDSAKKHDYVLDPDGVTQLKNKGIPWSQTW